MAARAGKLRVVALLVKVVTPEIVARFVAVSVPELVKVVIVEIVVFLFFFDENKNEVSRRQEME